LERESNREGPIDPKCTNRAQHPKEEAVERKGHTEGEPPGELTGVKKLMNHREPPKELYTTEDRTDKPLDEDSRIHLLRYL
jgi:hypothetical protein